MLFICRKKNKEWTLMLIKWSLKKMSAHHTRRIQSKKSYYLLRMLILNLQIFVLFMNFKKSVQLLCTFLQGELKIAKTQFVASEIKDKNNFPFKSKYEKKNKMTAPSDWAFRAYFILLSFWSAHLILTYFSKLHFIFIFDFMFL